MFYFKNVRENKMFAFLCHSLCPGCPPHPLTPCGSTTHPAVQASSGATAGPCTSGGRHWVFPISKVLQQPALGPMPLTTLDVLSNPSLPQFLFL